MGGIWMYHLDIPEEMEGPSEKCLFENQKGHHFSTCRWFHSPGSTLILGPDSALKVDWKYHLLRSHIFFSDGKTIYDYVWGCLTFQTSGQIMNHVSSYLCEQRFKTWDWMDWLGLHLAVGSFFIETLKWNFLTKRKTTGLNGEKSMYSCFSLLSSQF